MKIGVPKETKDKENRVALTPEGAASLVQAGHMVVVERGAGVGSGFGDAMYEAAGAALVDAAAAWDADLVIKIKEPLEPEYRYLKSNILFTYLHLAGVTPTLTDALLKAGTTAIAYETIEDVRGRLPLLAPMSAVAGNMAATIGSYYLAKFNGGKGMQLGSVLGERYGQVLVIGDGVVGQHAAMTAAGLGAKVLLLGRGRANFDANPQLARCGVDYAESTPESIAAAIRDADLVVGAVLLPGARAPHVVTEAMVKSMQAGSVIVDVSIDQGGCVETARPTSHSNPVYVVYDVIHYCVTNMPGAYPRTSTIALTNRTLPYVQRLAQQGLDALRNDTGFAKGLNTLGGKISCEAVAQGLDRMADYQSFTPN